MNFEEFKENSKYNNGSMRVTSAPLIFKNVFTFGIQKNKFDKEKFTITLCLDSTQLETLKDVEVKCLEALKEQKVEVEKIKSGLYGENVYVKVDPNEFSTYKEDEELDFKDVLELKNLKVSAAVSVKSVFVAKNTAHLQLYLYELSILPQEKPKPKEKRVRLL